MNAVLNEAVCTGNPELIGLVLQCRDQQQKEVNIRNIPTMLERLQSTADYYIEMKWEFSSWGEWVCVCGVGGDCIILLYSHLMSYCLS